MDPDSQIIKQINKQLETYITKLNQDLNTKYNPLIEKINQISYDNFRQCILIQKQIPPCYQANKKYEISVNFDKFNLKLNGCINIVLGLRKKVEQYNWKKGTKDCLQDYQKEINQSMGNEIKRIVDL